MSRPDVLILGGGIIGLACARELACTGRRVEVLERREAGAEASLAAAGMLAPLSESPAPGPFLDACQASRDLWVSWVPALEEEAGISLDYDTSGALQVALDEEEERSLDGFARAAEELGERIEEIEVETLRHWVPDISPDARRALRVLGDHRIDNIQACAALKISAARHGVVLSYGFEAERVETAGPGVRVTGKGGDTREAEVLVLAAGAWSGHLSGLPHLPVRPVRGQMALLGGVEWPWKGSVRGPHAYAVRRGETGLLIGATVEEAGFAAHTTVGGVQSLLAFARRTFPGLEGARLEAVWAGLRPGTPDGLPILGFLPGHPVLAATGHFRNGILLAPWTARQVAALLDAGPAADPPPGLAPFHPGRLLTP
ncbi:MAG TPA: glycine oxidase ThiO [Thermoanaerobaculia bacterium]|nr:glycine oxidase ThiO [Thermoanaerobaculia bacterium]